MELLQEQPQRGHLDFKVGNSTIVVPLARSINTIVEPKLEPDPIEEILMLTQEEIAQPFFNHERFVQEEEELVEPIELWTIFKNDNLTKMAKLAVAPSLAKHEGTGRSQGATRRSTLTVRCSGVSHVSLAV